MQVSLRDIDSNVVVIVIAEFLHVFGT